MKEGVTNSLTILRWKRSLGSSLTTTRERELEWRCVYQGSESNDLKLDEKGTKDSSLITLLIVSSWCRLSEVVLMVTGRGGPRRGWGRSSTMGWTPKRS